MIQKLRQDFGLELPLDIAQLPRTTYYYHVKRQTAPDKYLSAKTGIAAIYNMNKDRYGYRRFTTELHSRGLHLNHKAVQHIMKE